MNAINMEYRLLRKRVFSESLELDLELIDVVKKYPSHNFLINPAGQNLYLYLTKYLTLLSELHFKKSISDLRFLDWGTGKGHVTYLLKKLGVHPISCDVKKSQADSSFYQETPILDRYKIGVGELNHEYILPYNDESLDVVLSFGVLEHVENDLESLKEINRVLAPNGLFFCFFLPNIFSWTQRLAHIRGNYYHDRLYSRSSVFKLLESSNFTIDDFWHRQLLPKNTVKYPNYYLFERADNFVVGTTFLKHFATNIEFVSHKN
jgi:SAM-dependent methyltransferase